MRRTFRWIFTSAAAGSAALCAVACVLWARSYGSLDAWEVARVDKPAISAGPESVRRRAEVRRLESWRGGVMLVDRFLAYDDSGAAYDVIRPQRLTRVPHWTIAGASAVLPAGWFLVARRRRGLLARRRGLCTRCGYDLRATPDKCPECGAVPAAGKGAA